MPKFPEKAVLALCIGPDCGQDISRGLVKLSDMHRVGSVLKGCSGGSGVVGPLHGLVRPFSPRSSLGLHTRLWACVSTRTRMHLIWEGAINHKI